LERVGGAVRDVSSREIVAWLREAHDLSEPVLSDLLSLSKLPAEASPLNLALTTMVAADAFAPSSLAPKDGSSQSRALL
jgi:hypothetical protein